MYYFTSLRKIELCYWIKKKCRLGFGILRLALIVFASGTTCAKFIIQRMIDDDAPHAGKYYDIFQKSMIDDKMSSKLVLFVALFQIKIKKENKIKVCSSTWLFFVNIFTRYLDGRTSNSIYFLFLALCTQTIGGTC